MKKLYTFLLFASLISFEIDAQSTQLIVRGFSEGFYQSSTGKLKAVMDPVNQPLICDSGIIEVIDVITNQTILCSSTIINTDGYAEAYVPAAFSGMDYTISIKFKNTFHLLSATPILLNGQTVTVDLTVPQNACCNFDTTYGVAKAFSGDVNYDGSVDLLDLTLWENDYHNNPNGYNNTDVNGDHIVDTVDLFMMQAHSDVGATDDYFSNCTPTIFSEVSDLENKLLNVYPNPASTQINLSCFACAGKDLKITIFDISGRAVKKLLSFKNINESIDVSNLTSGLYLIQLLSEDSVSTVRNFVIR